MREDDPSGAGRDAFRGEGCGHWISWFGFNDTWGPEGAPSSPGGAASWGPWRLLLATRDLGLVGVDEERFPVA